jgi:HlyD family secretion protein
MQQKNKLIRLTTMNFFTKIKTYILAHKIISLIVLIVVIYSGYKIFFTQTGATQTLYTLGTVKRGAIISSLSESGQVTATNQINIQTKASGNITWVGVKSGDTVRTGQVIATIDNTSAKQAVSDAEASLATAKLQYQQDQAQAPVSFQNAQNNLQTAQTNLINEYNNAFTTISNAYLDLPTVMTGMESVLAGYDMSPSKTQENVDAIANTFNNDQRLTIQPFATSAQNDTTAARAAYNPSLLAYKQLTRTSDTAVTETMITQSISTASAMSQALQSQLNFLGEAVDLANQYNIRLPSTITTLQNTDRGYLTTTNNDLQSLLNEKKVLQSAKDAVTSDQQNISLLQVGNTTAGNNPISLQISQANIAKQEVDLQNLKNNLNNYSVVAPFAGTISSVNAVVGASAGTIATIVTKQQIAVLSLNEVDTAKVTIGQKVTLTFDAIDGLTMTGKVAEIDTVGTVTQGVVSYNVQITFDTQNDQVKPGMTVNAVIQTAVHPDTLSVPSGAVKTSGGANYVQAFVPPLDTSSGVTSMPSVTLPEQIPVTTGISDNTNVEILAGITEGQQIVTKTTIGAPVKTTTTTSAASLLGGTRAGGFGGGGGGGTRTTVPATTGR